MGHPLARPRREAPELPEHLTTTERALFEALGNQPEHMDDLCERTGLGPSSVTAALLTLTLAAVVVEGPAGFFRRASSFVGGPVTR
jgi:DNA processing protein